MSGYKGLAAEPVLCRGHSCPTTAVLGTWTWPQTHKPQLVHHKPLACVPAAVLPSCIPLHAANSIQPLVNRTFAKGRETENK